MEQSNLLINYIDLSVTESELGVLFGQFGSIQSVKIVKDRVKNMSLGYGFVNFHNNASATAAMNNLNGNNFRGKNIKVSVGRAAWKANIHSNVYIANLPLHYCEGDIMVLLENFKMQ